MDETILSTSLDNAKKHISFWLSIELKLKLDGPWEVTNMAIAWGLDNWLMTIRGIDNDHCGLDFHPFRHRPMGGYSRNGLQFINRKMQKLDWCAQDIELPSVCEKRDSQLYKIAELPDRIEWEKDERYRVEYSSLLPNLIDPAIEAAWLVRVEESGKAMEELSIRRLYRFKSPQEAAEEYFNDLGCSLRAPLNSTSPKENIPTMLDKTYERILEITAKDPNKKDLALALEVGLGRQQTNKRRKKLEKWGYKVR